MRVTIPKDADVAQFEIDQQLNLDTLLVAVNGIQVPFTYNNLTVTIENVKAGQVVDIEDTSEYELVGEKPIEVHKAPNFTTIKFRINSLDYIPKLEEDND